MSIEYIKDGEFEYRVKNKCFFVRKGDVIIMHPYMKNSLRCVSEIGHKFIFGLKGGMLPIVIDFLNLSETFWLKSTESEKCWEDLVVKGKSILEDVTMEKRAEAALFAYSLLLDISEANESSKYPSAIKIAIAYIMNSIYNKISLAELYREANVAPIALIRQFSNYLGKTPIAYIRDQRLILASNILENSNLSIKEIAAKFHFSSPQYFSSEFKRYHGVSPKAFLSVSG